ncbi:MAG: hypothetical protein WC150_12435 [Bacteroidia bacterium]
MKRIKIFIASAGSLQEERKSIETFLSRKNDHLVDQNVYLETVIWEKLSSSFSTDRKQDEFNNALLGCDIVICLLFDKVGPFTYEEFQKAYNGFKENGKPRKMYVYFKDKAIKPSEITKDFETVWKLKDEIKKYEQIYKSYDNVADLLLSIDHNLTIDLKDILKKSTKEELIELLNKINPEILNRFKQGINQTCVLISPGNMAKLNQLKDKLESERLMTYFSNGNTVMGFGNRIGNCINDKEEGMLMGFEFVKLENL